MLLKSRDFKNREFADYGELFAELRKNADAIIALKKAESYESFKKHGLNTSFLIKQSASVSKIGPHMKDGYIYPVINTTNYMDSHRDVHFDGLWNKSAREQNGKLFYVADHSTSIESIIAWPEDVNVMVKSVPWSFVGKSYSGNTEALIYEISKTKIVHDKARKIIEEKRPVQNSVRMMYVKIQLGMNSDAEEDLKYKEYYDSKINHIVNREEVEELGYFWGVEEAKIVIEGSMVIRGSNDATPIRQKNIEPSKDTQSRAVKDTRVLHELNNLLKKF